MVLQRFQILSKNELLSRIFFPQGGAIWHEMELKSVLVCLFLPRDLTPPPGARAMNEGEAMGTALWGPSLHIKNIGSHMQKTEGQL